MTTQVTTPIAAVLAANQRVLAANQQMCRALAGARRAGLAAAAIYGRRRRAVARSTALSAAHPRQQLLDAEMVKLRCLVPLDVKPLRSQYLIRLRGDLSPPLPGVRMHRAEGLVLT
jgi:hypothetical protein